MLHAPQAVGAHDRGACRGLRPARPDAEMEDGGDAQDGQFAEDEEAAPFMHMSDGPACVIADPDGEHDGREHDDDY